MPKISEEKQREREWLAEEDARVMAQYQEIMSDKARRNRAVKAAEKKAKEFQRQANNLKKVSKKAK